MQGKSADFAKHAINSIRKQRILVTFTKSQPRKPAGEAQRLASPAIAPLSHWGTPPSRSANQIRHPAGPKHYVPIPTTGVLPAPSIRPQIPPPNGVQPLFVTAPVAPAMPFPAAVPIPPGSTSWPAPPPRHHAPRLPVPGTGVFLPPQGSGNASSPQQLMTGSGETNMNTDTVPLPEKENGSGKPGHANGVSPKGKSDGKGSRQDCNGKIDGTHSVRVGIKEEQQPSVESMTASKPASAV